MNKTEQVISWINQYISRNEMKKGDRLPAFRDIAAANNVSIFSVKAALDYFMQKNILESRRGAGCFIKNAEAEKIESVERFIEDKKTFAETRKSMGVRKNGQLDTVALLISELSPSFYGDFLEGITVYLHREMYHYMLSLCRASAVFEREEVQLFLANKAVNGFIIEPVIKTQCPDYLDDMKRMRIPSVFIGDTHFDEGVEYDSVSCDNHYGMEKLVDFLIKNGHREIVYVEHATPANYANKVRYESYKETLEKAGLKPHEPISISEISESDNASMFKEYLKKVSGASAFVSFNDLVAINTIKALEVLGYKIPDDFSVCGFDDREMTAYTTPRLTTVEYPRKKIGQKAANILLDKITGSIPFDEYSNILIKPELKIRESSRAFK
jgi:DNA-binding LacI/PurR family transcriptional regulator